MPPYNDKNHTFFQNKFYKIYRIIILIYWILGSIGGLVEEYLFLFETLPGTMQTMNLIAYLSFTLQIIVLTISMNTISFEEFKIFYNDLVKVEMKLIYFNNSKGNNTKTSLRIWVELILTHLTFMPIVVLDYYLWIKVSKNEKFHFYIIHQNLQKYHTNVSVLLMCNLMLYMKKLFISANKSLEFSIKNRNRTKIFTVITYGPKDLIKIFLILTKTIEYFNRIFGWTILCINFSILANILLSLNFMIQFNNEKAKLLTSTYGFEFIVLMTSWAAASLIIGIFLTSVANSTVKEAKNTANVCYKLLTTISVQTSQKLDEKELRNDLLLLAEQIAMRSSHFTAAGFFNVDYTMLFTMLSTVTSYLVVLIQFS
nr:gustatory receptor 68a-like [Onthophagus taurus]